MQPALDGMLSMFKLLSQIWMNKMEYSQTYCNGEEWLQNILVQLVVRLPVNFSNVEDKCVGARFPKHIWEIQHTVKPLYKAKFGSTDDLALYNLTKSPLMLKSIYSRSPLLRTPL